MAKVDDIFSQLYSELQGEAARAGLRLRAKEGYRSIAAQVATVARRGLFGKGGTAAAPGRSYHNYGFAVDVSLQPASSQAWQTFGALAEAVGFRWGGRFSTPEPWHIDFGNYLSINEARQLFDRAYLVEVS